MREKEGVGTDDRGSREPDRQAGRNRGGGRGRAGRGRGGRRQRFAEERAELEGFSFLPFFSLSLSSFFGWVVVAFSYVNVESTFVPALSLAPVARRAPPLPSPAENLP